jgi:Zn-dependent oligopeptidase
LRRADGFDAFLAAGDAFDPETAQRVKKYIYSSGNSIDPGEAYRLFRGRSVSFCYFSLLTFANLEIQSWSQ